MKRVLVLLWGTVLVSCGSTGGDRFAFEAEAVGTTPATFTNANGWTVSLTKATFTLGPIYLAPQQGRDTDRYVGEVLDRVAVDALSRTPVRFPSPGTMTEDNVRSAEIWLSSPPSASLEFAGEATRGPEHRTFHAQIVLDDEWASAAKLGELRRVRAIPAAFFPRAGGRLEVTVDARGLFAGADFNDDDQVRKTAFAGLRATATYEVQWVEHR